MRLVKFVAQYALEHATTLKPQSADQIRYSVLSFEKWLKRAACLSDLNRANLLRWIQSSLVAKSRHTVKRERGVLLTLWREAFDLGLVNEAPRRIPTVKIPEGVPHTRSVEDLRALLRVCQDERKFFRDGTPRSLWWSSLLLAFYDCGGRLSAMLRVRRSDVDLTQRIIVLRGETAKTGKTQVLSLAPDTCQFLAALLQAHGSDCVWPWAYCHRQLFANFRRLLQKASLPVVSGKAFHSLRRTHATEVAKVFDMATAQTQLGHSDMKTTMLYVAPQSRPVLDIASRLPRP